MKKGLIIAVIAVLVVGGGIYLATRGNDQTVSNTASQSSTTNQSSQQSGTTPDTSTNPAAEQVTITYSNDGFSPNSVTVKKGGTVTINNTSDHSVQFSSDPHPSHTGNSELNETVLAAGKTQSFTVTRTGTFGYHNHLDDTEGGTIIVQ